jgi:tetratricopeptide (TPR) repeat protein
MAQACVEANPASCRAASALGQVHIRRQDYEAAQAAFETQIELARELDDPLRAQGEEASALFCLAWVWNHRASLAYQAGDTTAWTAALERSVEYGRRAIELDRADNPWNQACLMASLACLGPEAEALRELERYLHTMQRLRKSPVCSTVGWALQRLGRREEASGYLRRAVAATPLSALSLHLYSDHCEQLGPSQEATFWRARAEAMRKTTEPGGPVPPA